MSVFLYMFIMGKQSYYPAGKRNCGGRVVRMNTPAVK